MLHKQKIENHIKSSDKTVKDEMMTDNVDEKGEPISDIETEQLIAYK